ncbi:MAG: 2-oxoacid:acceptor oxidoreductase [Acidimicrobiaceae bacterium]|nr:2-oxoacid:acceptor oxidoreductase [Acidimicrobiaceae bacterium]
MAASFESDVVQIRLHGRGGQGTVTAAELLAVAAFEDGLYAQAFPSFGSERTGAPVEAYCRLGHREIRTREPVNRPHVLIIQDPTLLGVVKLFAGLRPEGYVLINTASPLDELGMGEDVALIARERVLTLPATDIALEYLKRPTPNSVLLGGFAAMTGLISLSGVEAAVHHRFRGAVAEANVAAVRVAYDHVHRHLSSEEYHRAVPT